MEEYFLEDEDMEEIAGLIENLNFETSSEDIEENLEELEQLE